VEATICKVSQAATHVQKAASHTSSLHSTHFIQYMTMWIEDFSTKQSHVYSISATTSPVGRSRVFLSVHGDGINIV
jgi:hypothetical protein